MDNKQKDVNLVKMTHHSVFELGDIKLRPLTIEDLQDYHEFSSDEEALKYNYPAHKELAESELMLVKWNLASPIGKYGIELIAEKKLIGNISLLLSPDGKVGEIGYTLNRNYWRKGYGFKSVEKLVDFGLNGLNLMEIQAQVHKENLPSLNLLRKAGFIEISEHMKTSVNGVNYLEKTFSRSK